MPIAGPTSTTAITSTGGRRRRFLTPSGEILAGSTYVVPDQMVRMLAEVCDGLTARYDELMARADAAAQARRPAPSSARYEPDASAPEWLIEQLLAQQDREFGGFGADGKFLNASAAAAGACARRDHARRAARGTPHAHIRRHGVGRHLRRSGRRVLPICRGPGVVATAHREDARGPGSDDRAADRCDRSCSSAQAGANGPAT